ncbi:hypothetical protein ARHIZOSPH14_27400 [Agromyces rhizosphaerae]|uniref:Uncharacterized protein n=1 Tax=Agromyces rhizosphaerae TaxID=88374 RepID=A0A9W6CU35_9MICO|nr:hypothetical protein [Agromyces rhizosphaerae]GLI28498.1 hypothetical protein ARHIZOSPH14_27400 [Agromyces rhizosphaerae]
MTERDTSDLEALHGQHVEVVDVDLLEDADGIPSWIQVEREMASIVIVPSLLSPRTTPADDLGAVPPYRRDGVAL